MRRGVPVVLALLLGACAMTRAPLALHDVALDPAKVPAGLAPLPVQLQVEVPRAVEPLSDVRIALRGDDGIYAVLPRMRWREPAPQLAQSLLVQALEQCRCLSGVARSGSSARADYLLAGELRELAIDEASPEPEAVARLALSLVRPRDGHIVAVTQLEQRVPLAARSDAAGVAALAAALNAAAGDAVAWLHEALRTQ